MQFSIKGIIDAIKTYFTGANDRSADFVKAVLEQSRSRGRSHEEIAASLFAEIAATAAPFSAMLAADVSDALGGGENGECFHCADKDFADGFGAATTKVDDL